MIRQAINLIFALICASAAIAAPTTLQIVDLRATPVTLEYDTWIGSLQGALNRAEGDAAVFIIRDGNDAAWGDALAQTYRLKRENVTADALFTSAKPKLAGQMLYDPAKPWTRNVALTAAAAAEGAVIVTDKDRGVPTLLDARTRWADRTAAYTWLLAEYGDKVDKQGFCLAPESGHLLADFIIARKWLAVDYSPADGDETTALRAVQKKFPAGAMMVGAPDNRAEKDNPGVLRQLAELAQENGQVFLHARGVSNLSCFALFPISRPMVQWRDEGNPTDGVPSVILIYDGGIPGLDGSQSLDHSYTTLFGLLNDPALEATPVGIQVPQALFEYAPSMYQILIARQRMTAAELLAAPNGEGWALPMTTADPTAYLQRISAQAKLMDINGISLLDFGGLEGYARAITGLADNGWRGAFVYPLAINELADKKKRPGGVLPGFSAAVATKRLKNLTELRAEFAKLKEPFNVFYLDPYGLPPSLLRTILPELRGVCTLMTPSQAFRALEEFNSVQPFLKAKQERNIKNPKRDPTTLNVSTPTVVGTPSAADAIPVSVKIQGRAGVLVARLLYSNPNGRIGAVDLHQDTNDSWSASLPPMLVGGKVAVRARVVEKGGFGISVSAPLTLNIATVDSDTDGMDDTLEDYIGTEPKNPDSDADGLPDGLDPHPLMPDRDTANYGLPIVPPFDAYAIPPAGASTAHDGGREIPTGTSLTYQIPIQDAPLATLTLTLVTGGPGTYSLNGGAAATIKALPDSMVATNIPITPEQVKAGFVTLKLTAGDKALWFFSSNIGANPDGPYFSPTALTPAHPANNVPITVRATVYSPKGMKSVKLCFGNAERMSTLPMTAVAGQGNVVFSCTVPPPAGSFLLYYLEAEDNAGHRSTGPLGMTPIGQTNKHSVAMLATRDITGQWLPAPLWGALGRAGYEGAMTDDFRIHVSPGTYYVWMLAHAAQRGIAVKITHQYTDEHLDKVVIPKIDVTIPAGSAPGWVRLGEFDINQDARLPVNISPVGDKGFCAYGQLVFTQDEGFKPPLAQGGVDWYNSLAIRGLKDGDVVTDSKISLSVLVAGNIDDVVVTADKVGGSVSDLTTRTFEQENDGTYSLSTRGMLSGTYKITVHGTKRYMEDRKVKKYPLLSTTIKITVQK